METISTLDNSYLNNGKKKSKFSNKEIPKIKKNNSSNGNNSQNQKEDFNPIFILSQRQVKDLYEIVEKKDNKQKKVEHTLDNNINFNIFNKVDKLRAIPDNKKNIDDIKKEENIENIKNIEKQNKNFSKKNLEEINFNIFPVKVEKFELINKSENNKLAPNEIGKGNNNFDVSNIALNQSDYIKQGKGGENEFDYILNKNKEMEDFGQSTPIYLLQEKCFIYIVSKWTKYSIPQPQSQLYVKYNYKTGHPLFDPITLATTNFTLWIEKIEKNNKKGIVSINSSINYINRQKKQNSKGKYSFGKKKGY